MEERQGVRGTIADGVFFTESSIPGGVSKGRVKVSVPGQNAHLGKVKQLLARKARSKGASAVANFRYGQKRSFLGWDDMRWFGEGEAVATDDGSPRLS